MEALIMEIPNFTNKFISTEQKTHNENPVSAASEKIENAARAAKESMPNVSELKTLEAGGTIAHSKDGDVIELSANAQTAGHQTLTYSGNYTVEATNLLLRGDNDSKIREQTGISQQQLERIKQTLDNRSLYEVS
jgi:DNA-directed RNA polymerase subunit H (RpoH/RPB5)